MTKNENKTAPKLTEAQREQRQVLSELRANLTPELYRAVIRMRRARDKFVRNGYHEFVEVSGNDLDMALALIERSFTTCDSGHRYDAGRAALKAHCDHEAEPAELGEVICWKCKQVIQ